MQPLPFQQPPPFWGAGVEPPIKFQKAGGGAGVDRIELLVKREVGMGLRIKKKYYRGSLKNPIFRGWGFTKNQYIGRELAKRGGGGGPGQFAYLKGA